MVHRTIKSEQFSSAEIVNGSVQFRRTVKTIWFGSVWFSSKTEP